MLLFTPPVAVNLITSAPWEICRRTARRQSSAPLQVLDRAGPPQLLDVAVHVVGGVGVAARPGDPEAGRDDRRPRNQAGRDGIPQRRHAVDVGAEVAHRREPRLERPARVVDADQQVVLDVAIEGLEPGAHLVVVVEDVHVGIDEARQDELALEVDQPGAVGRGDMAVTDRFDASAADDDRRRPTRRLAWTIEERACVDDDRGLRRRLREQRRDGQRRDQQAGPEGSLHESHVGLPEQPRRVRGGLSLPQPWMRRASRPSRRVDGAIPGRDADA